MGEPVDPRPPESNPLSGRLLGGRYEVGEAIGHGGMSTVFRARDHTLDRPVALKVIRHAPGADHLRTQMRERFRREAANVARIPPHPNIVQIHDYGTDPELDLDFIVMELLHGRDLKEALRTEVFAFPEAGRILLEAARGLAAGHRAGIVHRDVKPANIFLVGQDRLESVRILDFGIAKALEADPEDDLTQAGGVPHTPAYASPEQGSRGRPLTAASDVYQLGLVAYELLAGERPFDAQQQGRIRAGEEIRLAARARWAQVPPGARSVVEGALRRDPAARPPDAAAFAEAFASSQEDDHTLLAEPAAAGAFPSGGAAMVAPPQGRPGTVAREWVARRWRTGSRGTRIALGAALALLVLWGLSRWTGGPPAGALVGLRSVEELEAEFAPLYAAASARLAEDAGAPDGPEASEAVRRVVEDVNNAWAWGEMERHLSHYADRVRVGGETRSRAALGEERAQERSRYEEVAITAAAESVEFPEPGRAVARVTRRWRYSGESTRREGEALQEMVLEHRDGRWLITEENEGTRSPAESPGL